MSINKFAVSVALAGILGASSALAETSGAFVGVQAGYGGNKATLEASGDGWKVGGDGTLSGLRYGILGGYKQFFTPEFGARYYAVVDFSNNSEKELTLQQDSGGEGVVQKLKINTWGINANADVLYNFVSNESFDFGAFAGLSLGYVQHSLKTTSDEGSDTIKAGGFDLGINFGLRTNIAQNHGVELYSRFGLLEVKKEITETDSPTQTRKSKQPYTVGLRYSFSF